MKPFRVDVLEARGTPYEVGRGLALAFLKTPRGRAFARRRPRRPFAFSLKNAEAALGAWAPNIWEELHGIADGLAVPLERAVAEFSNGRLRYPRRGCSAVMSGGIYARNYDFGASRYDRTMMAIQPQGVHASIGFADRFTGRLDGMNESGLAVGLHMVNQRTWQPGLVSILIVRMVLDQCADTRQALALLRRLPHGLGFNYSLLDAAGEAAVVEAAPGAVAVRQGDWLACTNHFQSPAMQRFNRRVTRPSRKRLPPLEAWAARTMSADDLYRALNDSRSPAFFHAYAKGAGTLHTLVAEPAKRRLLVGIGGDATPTEIDVGAWVRGAPLPFAALEGQLGGTRANPDPVESPDRDLLVEPYNLERFPIPRDRETL